MPEVRLIDANALKKAVADAFYNLHEIAYIADIIERQPTIEAEPVRHGRWVPTEYDAYADGAPVWDKWECSECGHEHSGEEDTLTAFCPACGARMDATDTNVGGKGGAEE